MTDDEGSHSRTHKKRGYENIVTESLFDEPNSKRSKIDSKYIQTQKGASEIDQTIKEFIAYHQNKVDLFNQQEYIDPKLRQDEWSSARTSTKMDSKIKVATVENEEGPNQQAKPKQPKKLKLDSASTAHAPEPFSGVEERLRSLEDHLHMYQPPKPVPADVYARLKNLEDRVLALEKKQALPARGGSSTRPRGPASYAEKDDDDDFTYASSTPRRVGRPAKHTAPVAVAASAYTEVESFPPEQIENRIASLKDKLLQKAAAADATRSPSPPAETVPASDVSGNETPAELGPSEEKPAIPPIIDHPDVDITDS